MVAKRAGAKRAAGARPSPRRAAVPRKATKAAPKRAAKPAARPRKAAGGGRVTVPKADGADAVHAYIAKLPPWQADLLRRVDALVAREVPGVRRAVKWSAPFYGVPGKGWFASTKGFSRHVKLTFFRGASLVPIPPSGEHEQGRALDLREGDALDERLVAAWVRQAAALPGWGTS